jgi:hypothetical protein
LAKIQELLARPIHPLQSRYPIIANIYLSFNLVEHYFSPFLQKEIKKRCLFIMAKAQKPDKLAKEVAYIYC